MELTPAILEDFKKITGKDISRYFTTALTFFSTDYNDITNYFSGITDSITSKPFQNFEALEQANKEVFETFKLHSKQFTNLKWFLLIEQIEEIDNRLKTLRKINKWSRSSLTKVAYDPSFSVQYTLKQNQTLENLSAATGSNNPNDDWANIAISNRLREEDYTPEGGTNVTLSLNKTRGNFTISSIVDVIQGKSIYGKDVYKKIQWEVTDGNLNLKVLDNDATILQAVNILANLRKNDNPDNPNAGLQPNIVAGSNRAAFNFPIIIRQMTQTFAGDDTLKNFIVNNISIDQDNFTCDFTIQTRLGEVIENGEFN